MEPQSVAGPVGAPLTGCDAYFLAIEDLMRRSGQGSPVGLTVLELDAAPSSGLILHAARMASLSHPLLHAVVERRFGKVPQWVASPPWNDQAVPVIFHEGVASLEGFCSDLLAAEDSVFWELHVVRGVGFHALIAKWRHVLFDGRGAELMLKEIAAFAANPQRPATPVASWGVPLEEPKSVFSGWRLARPFLSRYDELKAGDFKSLGGAIPKASSARFRLVRFDEQETGRVHRKIDEVTGGIFLLPYFLAVAARAHAAVFQGRCMEPHGFQVQAPLQIRRRRDSHPIFQNQVGVLPFHLQPGDLTNFRQAVAAAQRQFESSVRMGIEGSFGVVMGWMRRLPPRLYRKFLQFDTAGEMVSFFHSHTGEFLKGVDSIGGALIRDGWHVPTVSQPPGSGLFFSERRGRLTATIAWRNGAILDHEVDLLEASLRRDLLDKEEP